jgi:hypothetical protein
MQFGKCRQYLMQVCELNITECCWTTHHSPLLVWLQLSFWRRTFAGLVINNYYFPPHPSDCLHALVRFVPHTRWAFCRETVASIFRVDKRVDSGGSGLIQNIRTCLRLQEISSQKTVDFIVAGVMLTVHWHLLTHCYHPSPIKKETAP